MLSIRSHWLVKTIGRVSSQRTPYVNHFSSRSPAKPSAVSLCRRRLPRRYRRRARGLPLDIDRARRIYMAQVANILGASADPGHSSRSRRRGRQCRLRWVVGNHGGGVLTMRLILGGGAEQGSPPTQDQQHNQPTTAAVLIPANKHGVTIQSNCRGKQPGPPSQPADRTVPRETRGYGSSRKGGYSSVISDA